MITVLAQDGQTGGGLTQMLIMMLPIFLLMYFLLIRPQRKQEARRREMIAALKKNDHVMTNGGILGVVVNVKDDEITLRVDDSRDVKIRVHRNFIASVGGPSRGDGGKAEGGA